MTTSRSLIRVFALCAAATALVACDRGDKAPVAAQPDTGMPAPPPIIDAASPNEAVVDVDGVALTRGDLNKRIEGFLAGRGGAGGMPPQQLQQIRARLSQQMVDQFVAQQVLMGEVKRQNIETDAADKQKAMDDMTARLPEGVTLEQALARNGMTVEQFETELEGGIKIQKLLEMQTKDVPAVTDAAVEEYYNENPKNFSTPESAHARHILLTCDKDASDEDRTAREAEAVALQKQLAEGGDFAELAKSHSGCPSKAKGGDLGTFGRGQMVKPFEDAAFSQEIDAIGPVVKTDFGYHIIQVIERSEASTKDLDEARPDIVAFLQRQQEQETVSAYVEGLKAKAKITYAN